MKKSTATNGADTSDVGTASTLIRSVEWFNGSFRFQPYSEIPEKVIPWMWKPYLAVGNLTLLVGDPEQGKSLVALSIAACITTGSKWPSGDSNTVDPGKVLVLTSEDSASYVVRPRFAEAKGNADNLIKLVFKQEGKTFQIEQDLDELSAARQHCSDLKLIIIDPVFEFTESDQNNNQEARRVLLKLKDWAEKNDASVLGIVHYNKKADVIGADRVAGAKAITAVPRFVYCVEGRPESNVRHLMRIKNNLAPSKLSTLDFEIEGVNRQIRGDDGLIHEESVPRIKWMGSSDTTPLQLQRIRTSGAGTSKGLAKQ